MKTSETLSLSNDDRSTSILSFVDLSVSSVQNIVHKSGIQALIN